MGCGLTFIDQLNSICRLDCFNCRPQIYRCRKLAGIEPRTISDSVMDPDPGSVAFLTPESGMGKKSGSGSGIRIRVIFRELRNHFFGLKYLNSLMRIRDLGWKKFGSWIRDGRNSDPGSGINIPDPQHWFQSLHRQSDLLRHLISTVIFGKYLQYVQVVTCMIGMPCVAAAAGAPRGGGGGAVCSCCARCSGGHLPPPGQPAGPRGGLATPRLRLLPGMYQPSLVMLSWC
jgi:hypothetical protein